MATQTKNPFTWVEIYVENMSRAQKFYEAVLQIKMIPMQTPGEMGDLEMLSFPWSEGEANISGALCKTREMNPGTGGTLVYFILLLIKNAKHFSIRSSYAVRNKPI